MMYALALERDLPTSRCWSRKDHAMIDYAACTDGELALAWRKGAAEALRTLVDRHRAAAFGLALRLCGNRDQAEDLAQEAFLRAVSRIQQYRSDEPFRPWLFRILGHLYIDQLRRRREQQGDEATEPPPVSGTSENDLFIQSVLATLNNTQRAILILRELAGLSYEDLARHFVIPLGTVRSRLAHARIAFRTAYLRMSDEEVSRSTGTVRVRARAMDVYGLYGNYQGTLSSRGERLSHDKSQLDPYFATALYHAPTVLIRTDKAVYHAGDIAQIAVLAPGQQGIGFLEVRRATQPVQTRSIMLVNGKAQLSLPISNDLAGILLLQAYLPAALARQSDNAGYNEELPTLVAQGSRAILVQPAEGLNISMAGLKNVRPGDEQRVKIRVADAHGRGVAAAVALSGVDEAVFALEEQYPGLARLFAQLQQELNDPSIEVHSAALPERYQLDNGLPTVDTAGRVALAAYSAQSYLAVDAYGSRAHAHAQGQHDYWMWFFPQLLLGALFLLLMCITCCANIHKYLQQQGQHPESFIFLQSLTMFISICFCAALLMGEFQSLGIVSACGMWIYVLVSGTNKPANTLVTTIIVFICITLFSIFNVSFGKRSWGHTQSAFSLENSDNKQKATSAAQSGSAADIRVREYFPETLTWQPEIITDRDGQAEVTLPAADAVTTWRLSLLANAQDGSMGSADIPYRVYQDFFVDLDAPAQLTVGDRLSLPVTVHNYAKTAQVVTLTLDANSGVAPDGVDTVPLTVAPGGVATGYFPLRAVAAGHAQLTVKAVSPSFADAVRRHLEVIPAGERVEVTQSAVLRGQARLAVTLPPAADPATSDLSLRCYPGPMSQVLGGLAGMLQRPYGCFEQTTSITYPNLMVLRYLRENNSTDVQSLATAQSFVALGYQRLLTFEVAGGGFSLYGESPAEFSLSALGLAEFEDMNEVQTVDPALLRRTSAWLSDHWDGATPLWRSFAAYPLARAEHKAMAAQWISTRAGQMNGISTFELAVLANAAQRTDHPAAPVLLKELATRVQKGAVGSRWWDDAHAQSRYTEAWLGNSDVEETALAVQALARDGAYPQLVHEGVDYLVSTRVPDGGWADTQATVQALRALLAVNGAGANGTVEVRVNGKKTDDITLKGDRVVKDIELRPYLTRGQNVVELRANAGVSPVCQLVAGYYAPWQSAAPAAHNPVSVSYDKTALQANDIVTATVRVAVARPIDMAMIDLAVPPGFAPFLDDLEALKRAGNIARYDDTGVQLMLYLHNLPGGVPFTPHYRLRALYPVRATIRPSRVYPYYHPEQVYRSAPEQVEVK